MHGDAVFSFLVSHLAFCLCSPRATISEIKQQSQNLNPKYYTGHVPVEPFRDPLEESMKRECIPGYTGWACYNDIRGSAGNLTYYTAPSRRRIRAQHPGQIRGDLCSSVRVWKTRPGDVRTLSLLREKNQFTWVHKFGRSGFIPEDEKEDHDRHEHHFEHRDHFGERMERQARYALGNGIPLAMRSSPCPGSLFRYHNAIRLIEGQGQSQRQLLKLVQAKIQERVNSHADQLIKLKLIFAAFDLDGASKRIPLGRALTS